MFYISLLIFLGIIFLVAELVFLSGSFVGTVLSIICYGSAIWLAFAGYGYAAGLTAIGAVAVLSLAATVISLRAKTWQRLSLSQEIRSSSMAYPEETLKTGDRGLTLSRLSPAGKVEIGGRIYEAKSTGTYIDQRTEIEVCGFENFSVIVKPAKETI